MPIFTKASDVYEYLFNDTLENNEGELYLLLKLLMYMGGYPRKGVKHIGLGGLDCKRDSMPLLNIKPKGWSLQKTYIYLFNLFAELEIKPQATFHKEIYLRYSNGGTYDQENPLFNTFYENKNADVIFSDTYFFCLQDDILEFVEIRNNFNSSKNIEVIRGDIDCCIDEFIHGQISERYGLLSYEKQRNIVISKLSDFFTLVGHSLNIRADQFEQYKATSFIYMMALLWRLEYIHIRDYYISDAVPKKDKEGRYLQEKENLNFNILITSKAQSLFEGLFKVKNLILDKVFDEEYKHLEITKKKGKLYMLEASKEVMGDASKFVELKRQHAHSRIATDIYNSELMKYEIKEKIRLDKIET